MDGTALEIALLSVATTIAGAAALLAWRRRETVVARRLREAALRDVVPGGGPK